MGGLTHLPSWDLSSYGANLSFAACPFSLTGPLNDLSAVSQGSTGLDRDPNLATIQIDSSCEQWNLTA